MSPGDKVYQYQETGEGGDELSGLFCHECDNALTIADAYELCQLMIAGLPWQCGICNYAFTFDGDEFIADC